jgi:hypothetical protein
MVVAVGGGDIRSADGCAMVQRLFDTWPSLKKYANVRRQVPPADRIEPPGIRYRAMSVLRAPSRAVSAFRQAAR